MTMLAPRRRERGCHVGRAFDQDPVAERPRERAGVRQHRLRFVRLADDDQHAREVHEADRLVPAVVLRQAHRLAVERFGRAELAAHAMDFRATVHDVGEPLLVTHRPGDRHRPIVSLDRARLIAGRVRGRSRA